MKFVTISGPPTSGKTSVILQTVRVLREKNAVVGVVKFDCLATDDDVVYQKHDIPYQVGLSGGLCPDHYFGNNVEECYRWGEESAFDILIIESAGLCNRCSPHIRGAFAVCVVDNLMGANAPRKIGPMLKMADAVAITKGDIVSQAEREVFAFHVRRANAACIILPVSGVTGQGCAELARLILTQASELSGDMTLRFPMPAALCSYCLGETHLEEGALFGNQRKMVFRS
jgi:Ni2+-binding GTPase involved in maturation of urease and hydrogenase